MKKVILSMILFSFIGCGIISAQNNQSNPQQREINYEELMQKRINRVKESLILDDATAAKFTPLYKEYLTAIKSCFASYPVKNRKNLTDAEKETCMQHRLECRQKMLDIQKSYYPKFKQILNASQLEKLFSYGNGRNYTGRQHYKHHSNRRRANAPHCNATHQQRQNGCCTR